PTAHSTRLMLPFEPPVTVTLHVLTPQSLPGLLLSVSYTLSETVYVPLKKVTGTRQLIVVLYLSFVWAASDTESQYVDPPGPGSTLYGTLCTTWCDTPLSE